jgi:hypothetical protein
VSDSLTHRITTEQASRGPPAVTASMLSPPLYEHAAQWTSICKRAKFALSSFVVTAQVPTPIPALTSRRERPVLRAVHFGRHSAHRGHSFNKGPRPDGASFAYVPTVRSHRGTHSHKLPSASFTIPRVSHLRWSTDALIIICLSDAHKVALSLTVPTNEGCGVSALYKAPSAASPQAPRP